MAQGDGRVFLRRKSDGKFFRGARWWQWCRSWRHAAALDRGFWEAFVVWKLKRDGIEYEYRTLDEIEM